jgi:hypothetical protein
VLGVPGYPEAKTPPESPKLKAIASLPDIIFFMYTTLSAIFYSNALLIFPKTIHFFSTGALQ